MDLEKLNTTLAKFQGVTLDRVGRSLRFRTMNVLARFEPVRQILSWGAGTPRSDVRSGTFPGFDTRGQYATLKRDGIAVGIKLPDDLRDEILAWANRTPVYGNICKEWGFHVGDRAAAEKKAGTRFTVGHYFNTSDCPAVRRLVEDPLIAEMARAYIGARAKYLSTHMWWSFANEVSEADRNSYAQQYHFDLDDYRFMKFFFYLTDVDLDSGPHTYMRGTHHAKKMKDLFPMRRFTDEEVHAQWGKEREVKVTAKAGEGFIVDTWGIHKGTPPRSRDRLVIELEWGHRYYGFGNDEVPQHELSLL
ncbi:MAG: phytanoyl-CoA dioxygenase family protein [Deltaproteobacteria bacterium]|nr:phytanoyl-CoA dioxygenase family protein [Deltaproteobacteria bacterium]